jgi:hypothetical protein
MIIKFSMAAQETLTKEQMQHYNDKIKEHTRGDIYGSNEFQDDIY